MKEAMLMMTQFYFVKCSRQQILFLLNLVQMLFRLFMWWAAEDDSRIFMNFNSGNLCLFSIELVYLILIFRNTSNF